ncbi:MAG TPA: ABC transporter permease [Dehalococcoidales bacterium]|nr:ABC transporter permease [Dehalococcoidales bacterium]
MIRRLVTRDSVALTGSVIGLVSLLFGWLTLKPNRVAAGTSFCLWESTGWPVMLAMTGLWVTCLVLSLVAGKVVRKVSLGAIANLIVAVTFITVGCTSGRLLETQDAIARVSLGAGFWLTLGGAYIVVFSARQGLQERRLWRHLVSLTGVIVFIVLLAVGWFDQLSVLQEFSGRQERFLQELQKHVLLFGGSVSVGTVFGILLGIWATRSRRAERPIFFLANITQTIPSLALFGLLIAPLSALSFAVPWLRDIGIRGVGVTPAVIALVIYSLLPIVRNTYVGLRQVDVAAIDAGLGMGMTRAQVFRKIEVPLAAPLVLEGIRTASVQSVGLTTVAALIGAGGLGWFIFRGVGQQAPDLILVGAIPIIFLALLVDILMRGAVRWATPRGLREGEG